MRLVALSICIDGMTVKELPAFLKMRDLQRVAGWIVVPDQDLSPFATARANGSLALGQLLQRGLRTSPQQHPEQGQAR
jgi:hypothetical protein